MVEVLNLQTKMSLVRVATLLLGMKRQNHVSTFTELNGVNQRNGFLPSTIASINNPTMSWAILRDPDESCRLHSLRALR